LLSDWKSWDLFWELFNISEWFFFLLQKLFFSMENNSHSIVMHVLEFLMNLSDLLIGQTVGLSVDKALDGGDLFSVNEIWVISIVVDGVKISVKDFVIKEVMAFLVDALVHNSADDLEEVSAHVVLLTLERL